MKKCNQCDEIKEFSEFRKAKSCKDGLRGECKDCSKMYRKQHYLDNKEEYIKNAGEWQNNHKEHRKQYCAEYQINNKNQIKDKKRENYLKNKEEILLKNKQRRRENPGSRRSEVAQRRAQKLNATMAGHNKEISRIYKNCPKGYHVDHIVPLQGKTVRGLHVPWNLQYLTAEENLKKSNKLEWCKDGN